MMTFKAHFYKSPEDVVCRSVNFDQVREDELILQVDACGICGTDINAILRGAEGYTPLGHEVAGRIIDPAGNLLPQAVVLESSSACGRCSYCRNARPDLCIQVKSFFQRPYFGLAEYMLAPQIAAVPYTGLSPEVACLSEPLGVALDLCDVSDIRISSVVMIVGLGPIGLMALRLAKLMGAAKIYAVSFSKREKRNALALEFGADELLFEDEMPLAKRRLDPAPDRILTSALPNTIGNCVTPSANGAIISYIGVGHGETDRIELSGNEFHFKKLQLRSSFASPALRTPQALEILKSGRVDGEKLITHRFAFEDTAEAIRVACRDKNEAIKVVVLN